MTETPIISFRRADIHDRETLNTISFTSKGYWGYPTSWMEQWRDELALDAVQFLEQHILIIEYGQKPIGFSSLVEHTDRYELLHLWILPDYIGKGFGKKLLDETIRTFVKTDKEIVVEADPHAESFYKKQGFVTVDKVESFPKGRFLPVMKKDHRSRL